MRRGLFGGANPTTGSAAAGGLFVSVGSSPATPIVKRAADLGKLPASTPVAVTGQPRLKRGLFGGGDAVVGSTTVKPAGLRR